MFQTSLNAVLQSWGSETWTGLMRAVSALGYEAAFGVVLAVVVFGVSFRRGFVLLQLVLWSSVLNSALKDLLALPRPVHVDPGLLNDGAANTAAVTSEPPAVGFFDTLPPDVVARVRAAVPAGGDDFGFPSGHVQQHTVVWGCAAQLWDDRRIAQAAPAAVAVMALSRMYLGRHFLADVLGGALAGAVLVAAVWAARHSRWRPALAAGSAARVARPTLLAWLLFAAAPLAVLPFYPGRAGTMTGVGLGFLAVLAGGLPPDTGTFRARAERVGLALLLFVLAGGLLALAGGMLGLSGPAWAFVSKGLPAFVMVWGGVAAARRRGLY